MLPESNGHYHSSYVWIINPKCVVFIVYDITVSSLIDRLLILFFTGRQPYDENKMFKNNFILII